MPDVNSRTATRTATLTPRSVTVVVPLAIAAVLLLIAPLGLGWMHVPANPALETPATTLSFGDIRDVISAGMAPTNGLQEAYFNWLSWTLIVATIALSLALVVTRARLAAYATGVAALLGLALTVLAMKGPQTWGQFWDQTPNVRIGGYVLLAGYLLALGTAMSSVARSD